MFIEDVVACMQSSLPLCSGEEESNLPQVCEEEAVQIEVFCLAVNCVDRLVFHVYATSSTKLGPIAISFSISVLCPHHILFPSRFLALVPLKLSQLQLLGSACLMVAWKVEIILKSHDMCHLWTDMTIENKQILTS